jgi:hypothetical protein
MRRLRISVRANTTLVHESTYDFDVLGYRADMMGWVPRTFEFVSPTPLLTLRLESLNPEDAGAAVDCLEIVPIGRTCIADVDDGSGSGTPDGGVGVEDLLYYLGLFDAGAAAADVDDGTGTGQPDGGVGIEDLLYYLVRFDAGC